MDQKLELGDEPTEWTPSPLDAGVVGMIKATAEVTVYDQTDADSIVTWYQLSASATKPSKPTTTSASATPTGWSTSEPSFDPTVGTRYLYTCAQTRWKDGSCTWGEVQLDSAYESAKVAYNRAVAADSKASGVQPFVAGTQSAATRWWTGTCSDLSVLVDGQQISYWLPYAVAASAPNSAPSGTVSPAETGTSNITYVWLRLTLAGGADTGWVRVYFNATSRLTTHFGANNVMRLTYRATGTGAPGWWADVGYNTDTINRTRWQNVIVAAEAITAGRIICGTESGYRNIAANVMFDLAYPLLYAVTTIAKGATTGTRDNNFLQINGVNAAANGTVQSAAVGKTLYLKGTVGGSVFTIAESSFLTCVVPSTSDGYCYIPVGIVYSGNYIYFNSSKDIYAYVGGEFGPVSIREASAAASVAASAQADAGRALSDASNARSVADDALAAAGAAQVVTNWFNWDSGTGELTIGVTAPGGVQGISNVMSSDNVAFKSASGEDIAHFGQVGDVWEMAIATARIESQLRFNNFAWIRRENGNMTLKWIGDES